MIPALPVTLAPPAPFPLVLQQSREEAFVAPGVRRAIYHLVTTDGPLSVQIVAVDPQEPTLRIDSVVAGDRMISRGEALSAMAQRTGAVAGVNADYFDIGQTNQPLNLVVRGGALQRTPSKRIVLTVHRDRSVKFERASFSGTATYGTTTVPLTTVNEWPPQGGVGFLNSAFGVRRNLPGVEVFDLVPSAASHLASDVAGTYRVASIESSVSQTSDATSPGVTGAELAFGPAALKTATPPAVGDNITIAATLTPPLDDLRAAVGGGPLLVENGAPVDDPIAPAPEERDRRFPVSGAGTMPSGELLLANVDGRRSDLSIGLTRPQFAALWIALGASDAMAFDSGGSSELVARKLGTSTISVLGSPSDGQERAIADGLLVYSDAPKGPAARLVVTPSEIVALPGVDVPISLAITDAAGHMLGVAHAPLGDSIAVGSVSRVAVIHANGLVANVPIQIVPQPKSFVIVPDARDPDAGDVVHFAVKAADATGRPIALGARIRWTTTSGTIDPNVGDLRTSAHDANVVATVAGVAAKAHVFVGRHGVGLDYFTGVNASAWQFSAVPAGDPGSAIVTGGMLNLAYDFTRDERAAYANVSFPIPGRPQTFSVDVFGDASGVGLRGAFVNTFGERRALTLAKTISWKGWQTVTVSLPDDLNPPVRLVSLYAFDGLAGVATHRAGTLAFRNATAVIAGAP